jgi:hypothetical protein
MKKADEVEYVTTFCNHPHRVADGKPVGHQCYVLPPGGLRAERDGDFEQAQLLFRRKKKKVHDGVY